MKNKIRKVYDVLQSKRKKLKKRSIFFILFLFSVNAYAWFVYMSNANLTVSSTVSAWNVTFFDGNSEVIKELDITTDDLYPGMDEYKRELTIKNDSNVGAKFSYEIDKVNLLGTETTYSSEDKSYAISLLSNSLPFKTTFSYEKELLEKNDSINFKILLNWPFESSANYYKLTSIYSYDGNYTYYTYDGVNYNVDTSVDINNFYDKISKGLYLESDDADSYWGENCSKYKDVSGDDHCFSFHLKLKVVQKN